MGSHLPLQRTRPGRPTQLLSPRTPCQPIPTCLDRSYFLGTPAGLRRGAAIASESWPVPSWWRGARAEVRALPQTAESSGRTIRRSQVQWPEEGGRPIPSSPVQLDSETLRTAQKPLLALEPWRNCPIPGGRPSPALRPGHPAAGHGARSDCGGDSRHSRCCKPVWLPRRASGDGARGWREKGKSLGGRRAGPAASGSRTACAPRAALRLRRALRGLRLPSPGRCRSSASTLRTRLPRPPGAWSRRSPLSEPRTGREGSGTRGRTHSPRRARIAHSQPRAPAEARLGRVWPRGSRPAPAAASGPDPAPRRAAAPPPGARHNIPTTCRLWRNWSRRWRLPNAARLR